MYKQERLKQQSASLNMSHTPAQQSAHFWFDEDEEVMKVKLSKALNKAKLFMESVKAEEQENQDKEQTIIEQFNSLTRTENKMPTGGVSDSSSTESDSSDSSDEEPSSVMQKGQEGKGLHGLSPFLHVVFG